MTRATDPTVNAIDKATSATYTPKPADVTGSVTPRVRATYTDSNGSTSATKIADNAVVTNLDNAAPEFRAGGLTTGKVITEDTREIAEDSAADTDIGNFVTATDPNAAYRHVDLHTGWVRRAFL